MKALLLAAALVAVTTPLAHADDAPAPAEMHSQFTFSAPKGWKTANVGDLHVYMAALDEAHHLSFQARVQPSPDVPMSPEFLEQFADNMKRSIAAHVPDAQFEILDKQLVTVAGAPAARFLCDMTPPAGPNEAKKEAMRQLLYFVPGAGQHAVLTYTAPKATFAKALPTMEASAKATKVAKP